MIGAKVVCNPMLSSKEISFHDGYPSFMIKLYRSIVEASQYLTLTRLKISFSINKLSQFVHALTICH